MDMDTNSNSEADGTGGGEQNQGGMAGPTIRQNRLDRANFVFFKIKIHFISFLKKQTLQKKSE